MTAGGVGEVEAGETAYQVERRPDMAGPDRHAGVSRLQPYLPLPHAMPIHAAPY